MVGGIAAGSLLVVMTVFYLVWNLTNRPEEVTQAETVAVNKNDAFKQDIEAAKTTEKDVSIVDVKF